MKSKLRQISDARCGAGKTDATLRDIVLNPALILFGVDKIDSIPERLVRLHQIGAEEGVTITTLAIHSRDPAGKMVRACQEIEALPSKYQSGHVVVFVTHAGLIGSDLSGFDGWNLVIDETPSAFHMESVPSETAAAYFASLYRLEPVEGEKTATRIRLRDDVQVSAAKMGRDVLHSSLKLFHRRLQNDRTAVFCNLREWSDMERDGVVWSWWSLWGPDQIEAFDRVVLLGNNLENSVMMRLWRQRFPEVVFEPLPIQPWCQPERRKVTIHYFSEERVASRKLFDKEGRDWLKSIGREIARRAPSNMIWTCNRTDLDCLQPYIGQEWIRPFQAGTSVYQSSHCAAIIYTAKADPYEREVMRTLGVDPSAIQEERELETILQFVTRTSVRDPNSTHPVEIFVFDRTQAEFLRRYFETKADYADVELDLIDLGFAHTEVNKGGRPRLNLTPQEARARDLEKKEQDRQRKAAAYREKIEARKAAGTYKPRGRPRKGSEGPEARP